MNLQKGTKVSFALKNGTPMRGTYSHMAPNGKAYVHGEDGKGYERPKEKLIEIGAAQTEFKANIVTTKKKLNSIVSDDLEDAWEEQSAPKEPTLQEKKMAAFDINHRFGFLEQMVRMVINGTSVSLVVTGEGGLGKTYTVLDQLAKKHLVEDNQYIHVKGYATARGLYRLLYENCDKIIVFDDCDSILEDKVALNLLKGGLDSYDKRIIKWIIKTPDESLPDSFEFLGRIIFISNKSMDSVHQAILSRAMSVDLTMGREDKILRMKGILKNIKPFVPMEIKQECLDLVTEYAGYTKDLNMRTLLKTIDFRLDPDNSENWRDLAIYAITNTTS